MTFEEFKAIKNRVKAELNRDQEDFILLRENEWRIENFRKRI